LEKYGALGTFYVCAGLLGEKLDGVQLASDNDLRAIIDVGHEIGCHTFSHTCLQGAPTAALTLELDRNQQAIEAMFPGYRLRSFAYPYGATGLAEKKLVAARYSTARSVWPGINRGRVDLFHLLTYPVQAVAKDLETARRLLSRAKRMNGWLILYTHDVTSNPSPHGCTPSQLSLIMGLARDEGFDLLSIERVLAAAS
jgi:peptidoglycan/xylan/chitin deacetylase (PgdA/CDA1 family)